MADKPFIHHIEGPLHNFNNVFIADRQCIMIHMNAFPGSSSLPISEIFHSIIRNN